MLRILLLLFIFTAPAFAEPYSETGLPLPRFVSLKAGDANMRKGPGIRYPIHWVYKRKHLPMEIINEFGHWRQVRDQDGMTGWMHKGMLVAMRYVVTSGEPQTLRVDPEEDSDALLQIQPGVIAPLEHCNANWCEVTIAEHKGWLPKSGLWGVYSQEVIE
jgi:SH3-like domain-containing protein